MGEDEEPRYQQYFKKLKTSYPRHNVIFIFIIALLGLYLLFEASKQPLDNFFTLLYFNIGSTCIVSAIGIIIFSPYGVQLESVLDSANKNIADKIPLLYEAEQSGIKKIFIQRHNNKEFQDALMHEFDNVILLHKKKIQDTDSKHHTVKDGQPVTSPPKKTVVRIIGTALRDFFSPNIGSSYIYQHKIFEMINAGIEFEILLLDPTSLAAASRSLVEQKKDVREKGYFESMLKSDICAAAKWLEEPAEPRELADKIKNQVSVRFFPYDPMIFLISTENATFVEQYHKGGSKHIRQNLAKENVHNIICFGGFVPVFLLEKTSTYSSLLNSHFENIWKDPDVVKRDLHEKPKNDVDFYGRSFPSYSVFLNHFFDNPAVYEAEFRKNGIDLKVRSAASLQPTPPPPKTP